MRYALLAFVCLAAGFGFGYGAGHAPTKSASYSLVRQSGGQVYVDDHGLSKADCASLRRPGQRCEASK